LRSFPLGKFTRVERVDPRILPILLPAPVHRPHSPTEGWQAQASSSRASELQRCLRQVLEKVGVSGTDAYHQP